MPEIIPLGWFHTVTGVVALVSGGVALVNFKEISLQTRSGQIYLVTTLITAADGRVPGRPGVRARRPACRPAGLVRPRRKLTTQRNSTLKKGPFYAIHYVYQTPGGVERARHYRNATVGGCRWC